MAENDQVIIVTDQGEITAHLERKLGGCKSAGTIILRLRPNSNDETVWIDFESSFDYRITAQRDAMNHFVDVIKWIARNPKSIDWIDSDWIKGKNQYEQKNGCEISP